MTPLWAVKSADGQPMAEPPRRALARGTVRHVGEAVAAVIAETLPQARDAADLVQVDYEPFPLRSMRKPRCARMGRSFTRPRSATSASASCAATRSRCASLRRRRPRGAARSRQQPPDRRGYRAARRAGRRQPDRQTYALLRHPGAASHPARRQRAT